MEALQILHTVANTGRSYKELICEMDGVTATLCCLQRSRSEVLCAGCRLLLVTLGRGNPTYAPQLVQREDAAPGARRDRHVGPRARQLLRNGVRAARADRRLGACRPLPGPPRPWRDAARRW